MTATKLTVRHFSCLAVRPFADVCSPGLCLTRVRISCCFVAVFVVFVVVVAAVVNRVACCRRRSLRRPA